jgi:teichuronic acid biosynthesis glycosyltransferase TuaG
MNSLVSVIMPYYNKKNYFLKSINSALKQTYTNIEILIIYDDQNRDDLEYIENCIKNDSRVKIIFNDNNKGAAYSRNKAISLARGEYIAFLDCDDYWEINKIEIQLNFMLTHGYDFSHTTYQVINYDEKIVRTIRAQETLKYKKLLKSCDIGLSSVILKHKLLSDMKFPELKTKEDFVLWLNLAKKSVNLVGLDKPLMFWRQTPNSLSGSISQKLKDAFKVYHLYEKKNFFYSIFCVIRLSTYALFKKINSF